MICVESTVAAEGIPGLGERVDALFGAGGGLGQAVLPDGEVCEVRPQQHRMAAAVAAAMEQGRHLAVEAGTGVGKTLAYLAPLVMGMTVARTQAVVSTFTISLQQQLLGKDIPLTRSLLGVPFKAVLAKGRANYLCRRRLGLALRRGADLFQPERQQEVLRLAQWAGQCTEGSRQELRRQPEGETWSRVCAEHGNCLGRQCPDYSLCFLMRARREVRDAHIVIVNHHLFFSELALRQTGAGFLPDYRWVVLDEAHTMEQVAGEHFGLRLSAGAMEHVLRRLLRPDARKGLLVVVRDRAATQAVQAVRTAMETFFSQLEPLLPGADASPSAARQRALEEPLPFGRELPEQWRLLAHTLEAVLDTLADDAALGSELDAIRRQSLAMAEAVAAFVGQQLADHVYWLEREGRARQMVLRSAPVEVAALLRQALFGGRARVLMTSATLAPSGRMDFFLERVGAQASDALEVGSPFNYGQQMLIWLARNMPLPDDSDAFAAAVAAVVRSVAAAEQGRTLVLFTSAGLMRTAARSCAPGFEQDGLQLLLQGGGRDRHRLLHEFRTRPGCVLFGLDSFWTGIDVRGPALTNVIITRLPFAVPTHPLVRARGQRLRAAGRDPFREFSLPEAILKFRQGVGRLIRTRTDRGRIIILDRRIRDCWYGRHFLKALPECPVEERDFGLA